MDTPHCAALPARLPSLMPRPHSASRPTAPAPLRLLSALQGQPPLRARATAWGWPRRDWGVAALAALVLGGAWVGLAPPAPALPGSAEAEGLVPAQPAARVERVAPPAAAAGPAAVARPAPALASRRAPALAAVPTPVPAAASAAAPRPAARPPATARPKAGFAVSPVTPAAAKRAAAAARRARGAAAETRPARAPAPARRPPGAAGSVAAHEVDPDAALLKAVMHWHERNPAVSASARQRRSKLMP